MLKDQVLWLRQQNQNLADRLLAVSNPHALAAFRPGPSDASEYYGSSDRDQVLGTDEFGQQQAMDKDLLE